MVVPLWAYVPVASLAFAWSSTKSPASNLILFAISISTRASICAAMTASVPVGDVATDTVGCV